jgi:hypothetical protein
MTTAKTDLIVDDSRVSRMLTPGAGLVEQFVTTLEAA